MFNWQSAVDASMMNGPVERLHEAFDGRRVLVVGHTGFKGAWLSAWLHRLGAVVGGLALPPDRAQQPLFRIVDQMVPFEFNAFGDISNEATVASAFAEFAPQTVFHLAAQPVVRVGYLAPVETFRVNVLGTAHVLESSRINRTPVTVCVTSDKCYENTGQIWGYRETDPLGGRDPYSASKGAAEIVISSYRRSFLESEGLGCASVRAGNVVGGGDLTPDRLIPDLYRAAQQRKALSIRNPNAIRPWQHVLEALSGYLSVADRLSSNPAGFSDAWNFGPDPLDRCSVLQFVSAVVDELGGLAPSVTTGGDKGPPEAERLSLDSLKATEQLGWRAQMDLQCRALYTAEWFRADIQGGAGPGLLTEQIERFESLWTERASR